MAVGFDKTVRAAEEESGCTRGAARFRVEKMQRIGEGAALIKMQNHEGHPHRMKRPYSDEEDEHTQATPRV